MSTAGSSPLPRIATRRWSEFSERSRRLIVLVALFEGSLKVAALVDLARQPPAQIRGSKPKWVTALLLVNSAGAVPIAYFRFGRRPTP